MIECTKEYLKKNDVEFKEKIKIKDFSAIKIGGPAAIVAYPDTEEKLCELLSFLSNVGLKYKVVGGMSNILADDGEYNGVLVKTDKLKKFSINGELVFAYCGVSLPYLAHACACVGLSGFERLSGIPGRIGASVRGNAGAYGAEISQLVLECKVFSPLHNEATILSQKDLDFSYRNSYVKRSEDVIVSVKLKLKKGDCNQISSEMDHYKSKRKISQPINFPSLGSVFKKTADGISAAMLIDRCGLRGYAHGNAEISTKHAGFIVNRGNASSDDVKRLVETAQNAVYDKFLIKLEREIEYLN